jgi:hypothetical protein
MITNHKEFIEAVKEKKKVCLRFYSKADSGVIDLVCAPLDYGPGVGLKDGVNRYWFWDYTSNNGSHVLPLLPEQILDLSVLGSMFDPAGFGAPSPTWSIARDWPAPSEPGTVLPLAEPVQDEKQLGSAEATGVAKT